MWYTVDRIEEDIAVLCGEDESLLDVARTLLPDGARQGDAVRLEGDRWVIDGDVTAARRARILALQEQLRQKGKS